MGYKWLWSGERWVLLVAVLAFTALTALVQADEPDGYLPNEVVVKLLQVADLPAIATAYELDPIPLAQFGTQPIFRLQIDDGTDPLTKASALIHDPRVIYAEPNFLNQTPEGRKKSSWASGGDGDQYQGQWAVDKIRLPQAHTVSRGAGVTIAVLDTGVEASHPVLAGRLVAGYDFVDLDNDPAEVGVPGQDLVYGHGTHVAGLVALAAPEAKIMPVRVLDRNGVGNIWVLAEALAYVVDPDGNPATDDGAEVINLSLGTTQPTRLLADIMVSVTCDDDHNDDDNGPSNRHNNANHEDHNDNANDDDDDDGDNDNANDDNDNDSDDNDSNDSDDDDDCFVAGGRGTVVVVAAGNSGTDAREYPAAEGVVGSLAIAASTPADSLADFSTRGGWVHVAAPGEDILSSVPGGGYGVWSGTSMAAPLVAGTAALIRSAQPNLKAVEVSERMVASAVVIDGPVPRRIDAAAVVGLPLN